MPLSTQCFHDSDCCAINSPQGRLSKQRLKLLGSSAHLNIIHAIALWLNPLTLSITYANVVVAFVGVEAVLSVQAKRRSMKLVGARASMMKEATMATYPVPQETKNTTT
eukprot:6457726-Amphidinium_carterae.1